MLPAEDSDQSGHSHCLIYSFALRFIGMLGTCKLAIGSVEVHYRNELIFVDFIDMPVN